MQGCDMLQCQSDIKAFADDRLVKSLSDRIEFYDDEQYVTIFVDNKWYKTFYFEELINYERPFGVRGQDSAQQKMETVKSISVADRDVYDADDFASALHEYLTFTEKQIVESDNPIIFLLALLDGTVNACLLREETIDKHPWLTIAYLLRMTGNLPDSFCERNIVTLDFRDCDELHNPYYVMRREMKWFVDYGESFDALWDILTGMPYFGDDFVIKRYKKHTYKTRYGEQDFTKQVDKICEIFEEAVSEYGKYSKMTVKIEYCD